MIKVLNYLTFVVVIATLIVLSLFYRDWSKARNAQLKSNAPSGQEEQSSGFPDNIFSTSPQVKKSRTDICHERGVSAFYDRTENFTPYNSLEECLASGGRLPK